LPVILNSLLEHTKPRLDSVSRADAPAPVRTVTD
jgi:hypothetical protein